MSVSPHIIAHLTALQAQIKAAGPLEKMPYATLKAIHLNAENLETEVTLALYEMAGGLDTWQSSRDQISILAGVQAAVESARDEWRLLDMLSSISRSILNFDLLIGDIQTQQQKTSLIPQ